LTNPFHVALISTGGTIEKTYDELEGILANDCSVLELMLGTLQLDGISIDQIALMNKDSSEMSNDDHETIAEEVEVSARTHDGVIVIHGTDTLEETGNSITERCPTLSVPCVLTGAMRPWIMKNSDAMQNLVESFAVVQLLDPGVYVAMHNRVLQFPGVVKDIEEMRFVKN
jgi:L-asparaginase